MSAPRRRLAALVVTAGLLGVVALVPAAASAATYYAQAAGTTASGCASPAANCNLASAVAAAHGAHVRPVADTIVLDAGTHTVTGVTLADDNLTLQGQGPAATHVVSAAATPLTINPTFTSDDVTVKGLEVRSTNATNAASGVVVTLGHATLDDVHVFRAATSGFDATGWISGVRVDGGSADLRGVRVETAGAVGVSTSAPLTIADSVVTRTGTATGQPLVTLDRLTTSILRTRIDGGGDAAAPGVSAFSSSANDANVNLQDVAITRTGIGVLVTGSMSGAINTANLDHVTVVPTSASTPSVKASKNSTDVHAIINVRNSILAGPPTYVNETPYPNEQIHCAYTALVDNPAFEDAMGSRDCKSGSPDRHNSVYAAGTVSTVDGSAPAGSPAIDAGDPAGLGTVFGMTESTTDVAGNPRVAVGVCGETAARRDLGAFEYQIPLGVGTAAVTGPDALTVGTAGTFGFTASGGAAFSNWGFGDGSSSALAAPTHAYAAPGTYTVSATLIPAAGCPVTVTKAVAVTALPNGGGGGGGGGGDNPGDGGNPGGNPGDGGNPGSGATTPTLKVAAGKGTLKKGAKLTLTASAAGTVKATVTQKGKGYRKNGKATCGTVRKGKKANCTRVLKVVTRTFSVKGGTSTATLKLPAKARAGTYAVSLVLTAGGRASKAVTKSVAYKRK